MKKNNKPNIILIVLDSARADAFSCYGNPLTTTPNIDKIAKQGILFKNAYSPTSWTIPSHASLFTGQYLSTHQVGYGENYKLIENKLVRTLKKNGYKTFTLSSNFLLHVSEILKDFDYNYRSIFVDLCRRFFLGKEYDYNMKIRFIKSILTLKLKKAFFYFKTMLRKLPNMIFFRLSFFDVKNGLRNSLKSLNKKLDSLKDKQPFFMFVNSMLTHHKYDFKYRNFKALGFKNFFYKSLSKPNFRKIIKQSLKKKKTKPRQIEILKEFYLSSVNYSDEFIGKLYDKLNETGLMENTILIITSDHGEAFLEHNYLEHSNCVYNDSIKIPLIIKLPKNYKIKNKVEYSPVSLIDLITFIYDFCNIPYNSLQYEGVSFKKLKKRKEIFSEHLPPSHRFITNNAKIKKQAVLTKKYKYIENSNGKKELYDIEKDPNELKNIIKEKSSIAKKLKRKLEDWNKRKKPGAVNEKDNFLISLDYI